MKLKFTGLTNRGYLKNRSVVSEIVHKDMNWKVSGKVRLK